MYKIIRKVIIYLRKSRSDEDDALKKHRKRLTDYADSMPWKYDVFEEPITSGERLNNRIEMLKVLDVLEKPNDYDGILVVDYDRLSRGNSKDFGTIIEVMQFSDTYIITPNRIYDTNDNQDLTMLGIQGVFANTELRMINKRLQGGKKDGAKAGNWTNGKPPYPYEYVKHIEHDEL